jgi:hypothetical protein
MFPTPHSEVLAEDWLPPIVLGRETEVHELVRRLDAPHPRSPPPWMVGVVGPRGSGTSSVARRAAREVADRVRSSTTGPPPRWIAVRTSRYRGTHGVASALLGAIDVGFDGRGFPIAEILAGFLRRIRRESRPCVLVLDDVRVGGPDLGPVVRAIGNPDRFLPEGESGLPPIWTLLAGTFDAVLRAERELGGRWKIGPYVHLERYDAHSIRALVTDRAARALGAPPVPELVTRVVERVIAEGEGAQRAIDVLRRTLIAPVGRRSQPASLRTPRDPALPIESRVVRAIEQASRTAPARLGEVRRCEARLAREEGASPLPPTTLWRRIVRLEQAGYVRREVRPGGVGGTQSLLRLVAPVDEWVIAPDRSETHPTSGAWSGLVGSAGWELDGPVRAPEPPRPPDDEVG